MAIEIMNTEKYAKEIYCKYSQTGTATQQLIRRMIKAKKHLPQVVKIEKINDRYNLLHVEI